MEKKKVEKNQFNIFSGAQVNVAVDHGTIIAVQNENMVSIPKKRLTPDPVQNSCFVGRKKDKETIIKNLLEKHKLVLYGIGGIGKTALAKQIYKEMEKEYDYIAWIDYKNDWMDSVLSSMFTSYFQFKEDTSEKEKYSLLFQFLANVGGKMLVVVDNFNEIDSAELSEITRLPADVLITSRSLPPGIEKYGLDVPEKEDCMEIFKENYAFQNTLTFENDMAILEIIDKSCRYPLVIELIAKAIGYRNISIDEFLVELRAVNYQLNVLRLSANSDWNNPFKNEDIALQISKVYQLSELSAKEQEIMQILSILPGFSRVAAEDLRHWVSFDDIKVLSALESRGWIKREPKKVYVHEIVSHCISTYYPVSFEKCGVLLEDIQRKLFIGPGTDTLECVKYAEYVLNIVRLKRNERSFCRHTAVKEAALVFKEVGKYSLAKELLDVMISNYNKERKGDHLLLAELYNNYSKILSMESNISGAMEQALQAEELIDSIQDDFSENFYFQKMIIKKTVGMYHAHLKQNNTALAKMREAIESSKYVGTSEEYQVANLYSDYSLLLYDMGDIEGSIESYKEVLSLYDNYGIVQSSPWRNTTYTNYADSLILNDQYTEAMYYEYQSLLGKYQSYQEDNPAIANALLGMGHMYRKEKRLWDVAAVFYQKAADIYRKKSAFSDGYCDSVACLSIVTGRKDLALEAYHIILDHLSKTYYPSTYVNVLCSLREQFPEKVVQIGEIALTVIKNLGENHVSQQFIYALMGEAFYKQQDYGKAKEFLAEAVSNQRTPSSIYYKQAKEILEYLPSLIGK